MGAIRDRIAAVAAAGPVTQSTETYILSRATDAANVKIRGGLMDIKLLIERRDGLERWRPVLKAAFPLPARVIVEEVFPPLIAAVPRIDRPAWPLDEFLRDLIQPHRELAAVEVTKTRHPFTLGGCAAEFADVKIVCGARCETVAIESADPAALCQARTRLGLDAHPNVNYVRQLKAMIGMASPAITGSGRVAVPRWPGKSSASF